MIAAAAALAAALSPSLAAAPSAVLPSPAAVPAALAAALKSLTGVVEHGLFLDLADQALIGTANGVTTLEP